MNNSEFQRSIVEIETRLTEKAIAIAHDRLVSAMTLKEVAEKHLVGKECVRQNAAKIEAAWSKLQREGMKSVVLEDDGTFTTIYGT
jgi:hypothetical protein